MNAGPRFGPYEIVRRLGVGGMAEAFLAVRRGPLDFEQRVCLKRVLPAFSDDSDFVKLFLQEASISASLRHSNIVCVLDFGTEEGTYYMALELVEGTDLRALLRELPDKTLPPHLTALIAADLGHALEYAHTHKRKGEREGIVHRDLSPSNVLLSYAGEVKLTDFGIAKAMSNTAATHSTTVRGKLNYMAPEQARGERLDGRSDLFSLGILLYELLAGKRPFDGQSDVDTLQRLLANNRWPLAELCPDAPKPLLQAIDTLLKPNPHDRFASASEFLDAIAPVIPKPTARRELGELVKRLRPPSIRPPSQVTPLDSVNAKPPVAHAERTPVSAPLGTFQSNQDSSSYVHGVTPAPAVEPQTGKLFRQRWPWLVAFVGVCVLGSVFVMWAGRKSEYEVAPRASRKQDETPVLRPQTDPSSQAALPPPPETQPKGAPDPAPAEPPPPESLPVVTRRGADVSGARLAISAMPWGEISVDGKRAGPAPQTVEVSAGSHKILVVGKNGTYRRTVRVRDGQRLNVLIRTDVDAEVR